MDAVVSYTTCADAALEAADEPLSLRQIREAVSGKVEYIHRAVDALVERGHIEREHGPRRAVLHRLAKPFREAEG